MQKAVHAKHRAHKRTIPDIVTVITVPSHRDQSGMTNRLPDCIDQIGLSALRLKHSVTIIGPKDRDNLNHVTGTVDKVDATDNASIRALHHRTSRLMIVTSL